MYAEPERARPAPPGVARALARPGNPLPPDTRQLFESRLGASLAGVRVHTDTSPRDVDAQAYTVGEQVVFAPGLYRPRTPAGASRLAHELTHVVQQRSSAQHRPRPGAARAVVLPHDTAAERQAHGAARAWASSPSVSRLPPAQVSGLAGPVLQRQPAAERAHYPTATEQARIEDLLKRRRATTTTRPPRPSPGTLDVAEPEVVRGRALTPTERHVLAVRISGLLVTELTTIAGSPTRGSSEVSADDAMEVVEKARRLVLERYGAYTRAITLTRDSSMDSAARRARNQVLVEFMDMATSGPDLARTLIDDECNECGTLLADVDDESKAAVVGEALGDLRARHADLLRRAALKGVGGRHGNALVQVPPRGEEGLGTAVHELVHELAHPAFTAAFTDEVNIVEGFTEYFARQLMPLRTHYEELREKVAGVSSQVSRPFIFSGRDRGEESMRQADDLGQEVRIGSIGLGSRGGVPLAVAGHRQRVDREHLVARRDQGGDPGPAVGLDADLHPSQRPRRDRDRPSPQASARRPASAAG